MRIVAEGKIFHRMEIDTLARPDPIEERLLETGPGHDDLSEPIEDRRLQQRERLKALATFVARPQLLEPTVEHPGVPVGRDHALAESLEEIPNVVLVPVLRHRRQGGPRRRVQGFYLGVAAVVRTFGGEQREQALARLRQVELGECVHLRDFIDDQGVSVLSLEIRKAKQRLLSDHQDFAAIPSRLRVGDDGGDCGIRVAAVDRPQGNLGQAPELIPDGVVDEELGWLGDDELATAQNPVMGVVA